MLKNLFLTMLTLIGSPVFSQSSNANSSQQIPVFTDPKDSILYSQTTGAMNDYFKLHPNGTKDTVILNQLSKVMDTRMGLMKKAIRFRTVYFPRYANWDKLSPDDRRSVTEISFSGSSITTLPAALNECKNLETLELVNCNIKVIPKLTDLKHLKKIYVFNSTRAGRLRVRKNESVTDFVMRSEKSQTVPKNFRRLPNLEFLDLDKTRSTVFPNIKKNKKLTFLSLAGNQLTLDHFSPPPHPSLEILKLGANKIVVVPNGLGNFPKLQSLSLGGNPITTIKPGFAKLTKLEYLTMYNTNLDSIPAALYKLSSLKNIDLYYNHIRRLDGQALQQWTNLVELHVAHNLIDSLPSAIGNLTQLRSLFAHGNHLTNLPESLGKISGLKELRVNGNYLTKFPEVIIKLRNLTWLDVSDNELKEMPEDIFLRTNLEILSLYNNKWSDSMRVRIAEALPLLSRYRTRVLLNPPEEKD